MTEKLRWGVLGVANIAVKKVIPAMAKASRAQVVAIASRNAEKARKAAGDLGIPQAYGSYEELLNDPNVDAIYNPLPNHLHVPWSIRAAEVGKHVLCEKPIALTVAEVKELIAVRDRTGVKIGEAFMVKTHPQWLRARELVRSGAIGELRVATGFFSYFNTDEKNVRNQVSIGGGALMDVGCYPVTMARFFFEREPIRVLALVDRDRDFGTDRLTSGILDFAPGQSTFTCSTQLVPYQSFQVSGTKGRIEIAFPFNTPPDETSHIRIDDGSKPLAGMGSREEEFAAADQYALQSNAFAAAVAGEAPVPVSLEDALANMAVIEALFQSAESGQWVSLSE